MHLGEQISEGAGLVVRELRRPKIILRNGKWPPQREVSAWSIEAERDSVRAAGGQSDAVHPDEEQVPDDARPLTVLD